MYKVPSSQHLAFYAWDPLETVNVSLPAFSTQVVYVCLLSVNKVHFTGRTKYLLHSISSSINGSSLKLHTCQLLRIRHNCYKLRCDRSIKKGTLLLVQSIFFAAFRLLFIGSPWHCKHISFCPFATTAISFVAIGQ
jgi:hypothetical protein